MYFATFFQPSALDPAQLAEACGDRAVIILDGRQHMATHHETATQECRARKYSAYQLFKGESFTRSHHYSAIRRVKP